MEKRELSVAILAVVVMAVFLLLLIYVKETGMTGNGFTGFVVYFQSSQSDFNEGAYSNTQHNGSDVILSSGQTAGTYTSKIFDASNDAVWNNISWVSGFDYYQQKLPDNKAIENRIGGIDMAKNVLLLHMDNNWQDSSGEGNHGTAYNGATFATSSKLGSHAGSFDGTNDYVGCGNGASLNIRNTITISAWIKPDTLSSSAQNSIVSKSLGYWFFVSTAKKLTFLRFNANDPDTGYGKFSSFSTDSDILTEAWTHVAVTYDTTDSNRVKLYIDGQLSKSTTFTNGAIDSTTASVEIARWQTLHYFDGTLDEVSVWNRTLSGDEIANIYKRGALRLNLTARTCDDASCSGESFSDIADASPQNLSLDNNRYFQYKFDFGTDSSSITPYLKSISLDYTLINSPPAVSITSPQDGATYSYNENMELNFIASDSDNNIDSCWYILNLENPVIIPDCQNILIDVAEGQNALTVYVNDTEGEQASDSVVFSVQLGAPTIVLNSPIDSYLNAPDVTFSYTPEDIDLDSCELWGDFDGEFKLNQTDLNPVSESENTFSLILPDRTYLWNIRCNDSANNIASNGNKTFYVDTIPPSITISEPSGAKTSRTSIPLAFSVSDSNPVSCKYNVYRGSNLEISNTSVDCSSSSTFSVTVDADFTLNLYSNDSAGNSNSASSSFSVSTSASPPSTPGGGSSSGGGGGNSLAFVKSLNLKIDNLGKIILYPGEEKTITLSVKNAGSMSVNKCRIVPGKYIESDDMKNLAPGEIVEFTLVLTAPKSLDAVKNISLSCLENVTKEIPMDIIILNPSLQIEFSKMEFISKNKISISYSAESDADANVEVIFKIYSGDEEISSSSQIIEAKKDLKVENEVILNIEGVDAGFLKISASKSGGELLVEDSVLYDSKLITGFSIINILSSNVPYIASILIVFSVLAFFIVRRILRLRKRR